MFKGITANNISIKLSRYLYFSVQDGRLRVNDKLVSINEVNLAQLDNESALKKVREVFHPDVIQRAGVVRIQVLRPEERPESENPSQIPNQSNRHNDSYILATQYGIKTFSLEPNRINRSHSLQEKSNRFFGDSVIYKGEYQLETLNWSSMMTFAIKNDLII